MKRALIIIDLINEFLHPDGKVSPQGMGEFVRTYGTIENARKLIDHFRVTGDEIIWIHLGFHENYDNCSTISPRFKGAPSMGILKEGTWSTEFTKELGYDSREKTITKTRVSPFYETDLEEYLREKGIEELIISGVATDLAVSSITRDGHDRDFSVTVISDVCATISRDHHDAALIGIGKLRRIMDTKEYIGKNTL